MTDPLFSLSSLVAMAGMAWNKKVDKVINILVLQVLLGTQSQR